MSIDHILRELYQLSRAEKEHVKHVLEEYLAEDDEDEDFIEDEATMSPEKKELLEGIRQGIHEAMTGQTRPAREVLAEIERELDDEDDEG